MKRLLPLVILTGLTMAPGMNAAWPWLVDLFGGRQSARSLHFIAAFALAFHAACADTARLRDMLSRAELD